MPPRRIPAHAGQPVPASDGPTFILEKPKERRELGPLDWIPYRSRAAEEGLPHAELERINEKSPLELHQSLFLNAPVCDITLSHEGALLACACVSGIIRVYETRNWRPVQELRDEEEKEVEEFYTACFSHDSRVVIAAGARKSRSRFSHADDDLAIISGSIKIFDLLSGRVLQRLYQHTEEVRSVNLIGTAARPFLLTSSQDGYTRKWALDPQDGWRCKAQRKMADESSDIVYSVCPLPGFGGLLALACCDAALRIYDLENCVIHTDFSEHPDLQPYQDGMLDNVAFLPLTAVGKFLSEPQGPAGPLPPDVRRFLEQRAASPTAAASIASTASATPAVRKGEQSAAASAAAAAAAASASPEVTATAETEEEKEEDGDAETDGEEDQSDFAPAKHKKAPRRRAPARQTSRKKTKVRSETEAESGSQAADKSAAEGTEGTEAASASEDGKPTTASEAEAAPGTPRAAESQPSAAAAAGSASAAETMSPLRRSTRVRVPRRVVEMMEMERQAQLLAAANKRRQAQLRKQQAQLRKQQAQERKQQALERKRAADAARQRIEEERARVQAEWDAIHVLPHPLVNAADPAGAAGADLRLPVERYYFVVRGLTGAKGHVAADLFCLQTPETQTGPFHLTKVCSLSHEKYRGVVWPLRVACNSRYVAVPSSSGQVFVWNYSGDHVALLKDHKGTMPVRAVRFHPTKPLLLTCADDGVVNVYQAASGK